MEYFLIILAGIFVNNYVLSQFLGICPFLGVSKKVETATGMGIAVIFVMTLASAVTYIVYKFILVKFSIEYMYNIAFILVIASLVQFVEMFIKKSSPSLYEALGVYLPLIFVESLKTLGDVTWYPEERKVKYSYVPNWEYLVPYDVESDKSGNISDFNITLTKNADGKFDITGKNYEYLYNFKISGGRDKLKFGFSIYMDVSEQTSELSKLFSPMLNWDKGEFIKEDTSFANQHMKVYVNGELIPITYVEGSAGNGHTDYIFTLDKEITNLNDIKTIQIECN